MGNPAIRTRTLSAYGAMGIPLAFAGLPIYVHVPHYYANNYNVSLAQISIALLLIRFIDAFQDPFIGAFSDKLHHRRRLIMSCALCVMSIAFYGLFTVPTMFLDHAVYWMAGALLLIYTSFSIVMINYYAAGLDLSDDAHQRTRISGFREGGILLGIIIAAALPQLFLQHYEPKYAYSLFALCLVPVALICWACARRTIINKELVVVEKQSNASSTDWSMLRDNNVRNVLLLFFINSIPTAITSTLFLFFVEDVLKAEDQAGLMLITYFLSAAISVGIWTHLASKIGKFPALCVGMVLAITSFIWAYSLGAGDTTQFYIICIASGVAIGADLTILPSLFADALEDYSKQGGIGFSVWNFLNKLNLSLAAGIILPLLSWFQYNPTTTGQETTDQGIAALSASYALIPCMFKCVALLYSYRFFISQRRS